MPPLLLTQTWRSRLLPKAQALYLKRFEYHFFQHIRLLRGALAASKVSLALLAEAFTDMFYSPHLAAFAMKAATSEAATAEHRRA